MWEGCWNLVSPVTSWAAWSGQGMIKICRKKNALCLWWGAVGCCRYHGWCPQEGWCLSTVLTHFFSGSLDMEVGKCSLPLAPALYFPSVYCKSGHSIIQRSFILKFVVTAKSRIHKWEKTWCLYFYTEFHNIPRYIYFLTSDMTSFFFNADKHLIVYICFLIHPFIDGHPGWFHNLALVNGQVLHGVLT